VDGGVEDEVVVEGEDEEGEVEELEVEMEGEEVEEIEEVEGFDDELVGLGLGPTYK
jgi:hypothetical protein